MQVVSAEICYILPKSTDPNEFIMVKLKQDLKYKTYKTCYQYIKLDIGPHCIVQGQS